MLENYFNSIAVNLRSSAIIAASLFIFPLATPKVALSQSHNLVRQATELYSNKEFANAAHSWQEAAAAFASQSDKINQAIALSNLSLTYQEIGKWELARQAIDESLFILQNELLAQDNQLVIARILDIKGKLERETGQPENALETWQEAESIYAKLDDEAGVSTSQLNQTQGMQDLGLYTQACKTLLLALELADQDCEISLESILSLQEKIRQQPNLEQSKTQIKSLISLGNILRLTGNPETSLQVLTAIARLDPYLSPEEESLALLSLGNTSRTLGTKAEELGKRAEINNLYRYQREAEKRTREALENYEGAAEKGSLEVRVQAQLNILEILIEQQQWQTAAQLAGKIEAAITELKLSPKAVYAKINLAKNLVCLQQQESNCFRGQPQVRSKTLAAKYLSKGINLLHSAIEDAKVMGDLRLQSHAYGNLGSVWLAFAAKEKAKSYTEQALNLAQQIRAADLAYQWYWQLGRLEQGENRKRAIAAYSLAVENLPISQRRSSSSQSRYSIQLSR